MAVNIPMRRSGWRWPLPGKGDGNRAGEILRILNPVEHARDGIGAWRYAVEPYVVAADVYRLPGRIGQGGWSWYTGSAAWMYRVWIEEVLGIKKRGNRLYIDPVIPDWWDGFKIEYRYEGAIYAIEIQNPDHVQKGITRIDLDGRILEENIHPPGYRACETYCEDSDGKSILMNRIISENISF